MAAKKTEEMTEEVKVGETTEEVKAEAKPEENPDERVNIYLMRDSDKYKGDVFVQVNGVGYIIQRGKNVKVPKAVAEVLQNSQEQDSRTAELIDQETHGRAGAQTCDHAVLNQLCSLDAGRLLQRVLLCLVHDPPSIWG